MSVEMEPFVFTPRQHTPEEDEELRAIRDRLDRAINGGMQPVPEPAAPAQSDVVPGTPPSSDDSGPEGSRWSDVMGAHIMPDGTVAPGETPRPVQLPDDDRAPPAAPIPPQQPPQAREVAPIEPVNIGPSPEAIAALQQQNRPAAEAEADMRTRLRAALDRAEAKPAMPAQQPWDHTGADWREALSRPFRALGAALVAGSGRTPRPLRDYSAESRQAELRAQQQAGRDRAGALAGQVAQRRADMDERRLAGQEEHQRLQRDISERMQQQRVQVSQERADIYRRMMEARLGPEEYQRQLRDPGSDVSTRARDRLRVMIGGFPDAARARFEDQWGAIDSLSGYDIERIERQLPSMMRDLTSRRAGRGGGGGGGGGFGTTQERDDALLRAAIEQGVPEAAARAAIADPRSRRTLESTLAREGQRRQRNQGIVERQARIPGFDRDPDAPQLSVSAATGVRRVATADAEFRRAASQLEQDLSAISPAERLMGALGQGSERYRRVEANLNVIRTQLRQINEAGNSLGAQEMGHAEVPGLDSLTTGASLLANIRALQQVKHQYVEALMEAHGYHASRGGGHGGERQAPTEERVRGMHNGRPASVPRSQLERAMEQGFVPEGGSDG